MEAVVSVDDFQTDNQREGQNEGDCARRAFLFALHLLENHRQAAENQTDKRHVRRQRIRAEQECDQLGQTQNAEHHAQRIRPKHFDAAFEVLEQRIDAADDRIVNAHGNHHRAAAYAGDDVGQTDNHAAQNVKNRFHAFLHLKFRIDRGILPDKDCLYIKTVRCSFGGRVLRNIFFAIVSASAVFVNRFFENLTFAWRVCRSAQNIDVFAVG